MRILSFFLVSFVTTTTLAIKECIRPLRTTWDEPCPIPVVAQTICSSQTCRLTPDDDTTTPSASVVAHALHAEFEIFDVILIHDGAVQGEIAQGDFTEQDATKLLPVNEELIGLQLNSSNIVAALEHGIDQYHFQNVPEAYPRAAGIRFHVNLRKPYGSRISKVEILSHSCRMEPLEETKVYHVLTNELLAQGGYGYASLTRTRQQVHTKLHLTDTFWFYAQSVCTIRDPFRKPRQQRSSKKKKKSLPRAVAIPKQAKAGGINQTVAASR